MDHPNIVTVYEAGESEYGLFIAMRLDPRRDLKDLIVGARARRGPDAAHPLARSPTRSTARTRPA